MANEPEIPVIYNWDNSAWIPWWWNTESVLHLLGFLLLKIHIFNIYFLLRFIRVNFWQLAYISLPNIWQENNFSICSKKSSQGHLEVKKVTSFYHDLKYRIQINDTNIDVIIIICWRPNFYFFMIHMESFSLSDYLVHLVLKHHKKTLECFQYTQPSICSISCRP